MYEKERDVNANILIVEDDDISRRILGRILKENEHIFQEASSAAEARKLLEERQFELILCDIGLPGESGLDFIRFVLSKYPDTAAVMVTGKNDLKTAKESIDIGAYDYITKPIEPNRLLFSVVNALRRREIERHKHTKEVLIESEVKYGLLINNIPGFVYKGYKDWSVDFTDNKVGELTGYDKEEFDSRRLKWSDLLLKEDIEASKASIVQALNTNSTYIREYRIKTKTGKILWTQDRGQIVRNEKGEIDYFSGVFFDITEQKQIEIILRESEERHRTIMETCADPIVVYDGQGLATYINPAFNRVFGWTPEELLGKRIDFVPEGAVAETKKAIQKVFQDGRLTGFETRRYTKSGHTIDVRVGAALLRDANTAPVGMVVNFQDITEESKKSKKIGLLNKQLIEKTSQVESKNRQLEQTLKQLEETQSQIMQSEKMASIGQLAAGVAHEINNPTGFVSSNLKTLSDYIKDIHGLIKEYRTLVAELKENAPADADDATVSEQLMRIKTLEDEVDIDFILNDILELIAESREGSERIKKIVQDLKDFAHPGEDKLKFADINKNLDSTVNVVGNELKYKAEVTKDYGDLPEVQCYPQLLNQVFVNILVNAAQAIKERGEIRIQTSADNGYVKIKISDTGAGIPKEHLARIFDPFFTTKEVGQGTGLGMNVAWNIIKKHKGTIDVESTVGTGTTFTIKIPVE